MFYSEVVAENDEAKLDAGSGAPDGPAPDHAQDLPDHVDLVVETSVMVSVFVAERFHRIDELRMQALADHARYGNAVADVVERSVRLDLASALRITEAAAEALMNMAESLVHDYPAVLRSLGQARITERHAEILVRRVDTLADKGVREQVAAAALPVAEATSVGVFQRRLQRMIEDAQPKTIAERHTDAVGSRRVALERAGDGMAWLHTFMPAVEATAIHGRLTKQAKAIMKHPDETRTLDQIRADIFGDLLIDGDTADLAPEARGIRPTVFVTVPALALMRGADGDGGDPAVVEGVGPIPIGRARELCGAAKDWMRVLTHPETGMVLSVGRDRYQPPKMLRDLTRWRADRCMAPGCGMPASRCEIDHTLAWIDQGHTSLENLAPVCKGHHTIKHHGGWSIRQLPASGGALEWTSPTGRVYTVQPERRVPVFRPVDTTPSPF